YENIVITPEVKVEITNMIAATHAQIDRQKVHYQQLNPAGKDRVGRLFSHLLRLDELMRKLRTRLETRARVAREPNEAVLSILVELVKSIATTLKLKKPDAVTASDVDERLVARGLYELLWNHRQTAIYTRDEDVRRITSAAFKLMVSGTVAEEATALTQKALKLGNLVVLKYNSEHEEYARFFESQTQGDIRAYIFSNFLSERAKVKLITQVRSSMKRLGQLLDEQDEAGSQGAAPVVATDAPAELQEALSLIHDRMIWYQEVARAVGVTDVPEEIRVTEALLRLSQGLGQEELARSVERALEGLHRRRIVQHVRDLEAREEALREELTDLTANDRYRHEVVAAERLGAVGGEIASTAREKHFFARALGTGDFHLTQEHFRRAEALLERLLANGYDVREKEQLVPAADLADLTGRSYAALLRLASEERLTTDGGAIRLDLSTLVRHFL
ncbi:MAG: hypothetical protein ACYS22_13790, partial [Planctomycetota bacterium]